MREVVIVATDTVASHLRGTGRTHLYVAPDVQCESISGCTDAQRTEVRETFVNLAVATVVQPAQRWPTLCDNSGELWLSVPQLYGDTAHFSVLALRAIRGAGLSGAELHRTTLVWNGASWVLDSYIIDNTVSAPEAATSFPRCTWSAEAGMTAIAVGASLTPPATTTPHFQIEQKSTCGACRLVERPGAILGNSQDQHRPAADAYVYADAKGRFFVESEWGSAILVYDGDGGHVGTVELEHSNSGGAARVDAIVADANDSLYVLDNSSRRISVIAPDWSTARHVTLPFNISQFWVLRDGRLLSSRDAGGLAEPLSVHSSSGEVLRSFGMALNADGTLCAACGAPIVTVMPSGYRVILAWESHYRLEEWDLSGRQTAIFSGSLSPSASPPLPSPLDTMPLAIRPAMGSAGDRDNDTGRRTQDLPGLRRMKSFADGTLWIELLVRDSFGRLVSRVDMLDITRGVLINSIPNFSLDDVVTDGVRADYQVDGLGFPFIRLYLFDIVGRDG